MNVKILIQTDQDRQKHYAYRCKMLLATCCWGVFLKPDTKPTDGGEGVEGYSIRFAKGLATGDGKIGIVDAQKASTRP